MSGPTKLFTVIGYWDGSYTVEGFVERVKASDAADAWNQAVKSIRRKGLDPTRTATEIITLDGHLEATERYNFTQRVAVAAHTEAAPT